MSDDTAQEDIEVVPVPLDRETRRRLVRLSELVGDRPLSVAGSILRAVLQDDADAHMLDDATHH